MQKTKSNQLSQASVQPHKSTIQRQVDLTPPEGKIKLADELFIKLSDVSWHEYSKDKFADWVDTKVCEVYWGKA